MHCQHERDIGNTARVLIEWAMEHGREGLGEFTQ